MLKKSDFEQDIRKFVQFPTEKEQKKALKLFIKREQELAYPGECKHFKTHGNDRNSTKFPEDSKILNLRPFRDKEGLLRASGRIGAADLPYDTRFPFIIPPHSRLSKALILQAHRKTMHGGAQLMIQFIRANYWIPRLRAEVKGFTQKCTTCVRYSKSHHTELMADLPADRVRMYRAFLNSGVDYAGPFLIR